MAWERDIRHDRDLCVQNVSRWVLEGFFGKIFDLWEAKLFALVNVGTAR